MNNPQQLQQDLFFPTPICFTVLNKHEEFNDILLPLAYRIREADKAGEKLSNQGGGYHSKRRLHHDEPSLKPFFDQVNEVMSTMMSGMNIKKEYTAHMLSAHINISPLHAYNTAHMHPNSHFSGVYYIQVPEHSGNICFRDPRPKKEMYPIQYEEETPATWSRVSYTPQEGAMLLFPAWLEHEVLPNHSTLEGRAADRISLSFNYRLKKPSEDE